MISRSIGKENIKSGYNKYYSFRNKLTVVEYEEIISEWDGDFPAGYDWWMKYTPFAAFFIGKMAMDDVSDIPIVTEDNYSRFIPIMKRYFLTKEEYTVIVKNVGFMKQDSPFLFRETPIFKAYNMMKLWRATPTIIEMLDLEYKIFLKLYLYSLGDNFEIPNREKRDYIR